MTGLDLRFERVIAAPPDRVFALFTSPDGQRAFYGNDAPGWVVESACDLRVGGAWTITFGPSRDELYRHHHEIVALEPPHRLALLTTETRLNGSQITFTSEFGFAPHERGTAMTVRQTGFPTVALRDEHTRGAPHAFDRLERQLGLDPQES